MVMNKAKRGPRANKCRFPTRGGKGWNGPIVDYKEVDLLRKFMTISNKMMSRKRAGTSAHVGGQLALCGRISDQHPVLLGNGNKALGLHQRASRAR